MAPIIAFAELARLARHVTPPRHDDPEYVGAFVKACRYAQTLEEGVDLKYIPKGERWRLRWASPTHLVCPVRGNLLWVGEPGRPEGKDALQNTPLYVVRGCVAGSVKQAVLNSVGKGPRIKWLDDGDWEVECGTLGDVVDDHLEEWEAQVPEAYWGPVRDLSRSQVFDLILQKNMTKEQFWEYLDHRAWTRANLRLEQDMETLEVEG